MLQYSYYQFVAPVLRPQKDVPWMTSMFKTSHTAYFCITVSSGWCESKTNQENEVYDVVTTTPKLSCAE